MLGNRRNGREWLIVMDCGRYAGDRVRKRGNYFCIRMTVILIILFFAALLIVMMTMMSRLCLCSHLCRSKDAASQRAAYRAELCINQRHRHHKCGNDGYFRSRSAHCLTIVSSPKSFVKTNYWFPGRCCCRNGVIDAW